MLEVKVIVRARQPRVGEHDEVGLPRVPCGVEAAAVVLGVPREVGLRFRLGVGVGLGCKVLRVRARATVRV